MTSRSDVENELATLLIGNAVLLHNGLMALIRENRALIERYPNSESVGAIKGYIAVYEELAEEIRTLKDAHDAEIIRSLTE